MVLKALRIAAKDICRLWDGHIDYPFFWLICQNGWIYTTIYNCEPYRSL